MLFGPKPLRVPPNILEVCRRLQSAGYQAFVVGGAVRDLLRGKTPADWDLSTNAHPGEVEQCFARTLPTGKKYGTISVLSGDHWVEITTFRREAAYSDGRRPDRVEFSNDLRDDLARRDFTVNAIAYDPLTEQFYDPFGGIRDIRRRILRTVGPADQRFQEDALRMFRLIRFVGTLGFRPAASTLRAIRPKKITLISKERVADELQKMITSENVLAALKLWYQSGLLQETVPPLAACAHVYQGNRHRYDVLGHAFVCTQMIRPQLHLRLAALFHDIAKPQTRIEVDKSVHFYDHDRLGARITAETLAELRLAKQLITRVAHLVRWHMFALTPNSSDKAIRRFIARVGAESVDDLIELRRADILAMHHNARQAWQYISTLQQRIKEVQSSDAAFSIKDLAVSGQDIMDALNLPSSPLIGQVLAHLLDVVLEEPAKNQKHALLTEARKYLARISDSQNT